MTQLPPFCFHGLRHASVRAAPAAAALAGSLRALVWRSPSGPGSPSSDAARGRSAHPHPRPQGGPEQGLDLAPRGQPWDTERLPSRAPRRGCGAGRPETGPGASRERGLDAAAGGGLRPERRRRRRGARGPLRPPCPSRATRAARVLDGEAPSDH